MLDLVVDALWYVFHPDCRGRNPNPQSAQKLVWLLGHPLPLPGRGSRFVIPGEESRGKARETGRKVEKELVKVLLIRDDDLTGLRAYFLLAGLHHLTLLLWSNKGARKAMAHVVAASKDSRYARRFLRPVEDLLRLLLWKPPVPRDDFWRMSLFLALSTRRRSSRRARADSFVGPMVTPPQLSFGMRQVRRPQRSYGGSDLFC